MRINDNNLRLDSMGLSMAEKDLEDQWRAEFSATSVERVRELLANDSSLTGTRVDCRMKNGQTRKWGPRFAACNQLQDLEKVKALVEAGADLMNSDLGTHWPCDDYDINSYMIERGVDVNQPSYLGFHGIGLIDLDGFYLLLENGLEPDWPWPYNGETPLHVQARHDDEQYIAVAYVLIEAGADVNAQALSGLDDEPIMNNEHFVEYGRGTPLHLTARLGNPRQARLLLRKGADPALKTVSRTKVPKETGQWEGEVTRLTWPLSNYERVIFEPYEGETPLEMAKREGQEEVARVLERA